MKKEQYTLNRLADKAGVPARTLRFYIARGLLSGPGKAGRNAAYGKEHLDRIRRIRELQSTGMTLAAISQSLAEPEKQPLHVESAAWRHYAVAEDAVIMVREDCAPWRVKLIRETIAELQSRLRFQVEKEGKEKG